MYKIIGGDQNEYGPVSLEELRGWIAQKRANGRTMVKREGSEEWKPLASHPELAPLLGTRREEASPRTSADLDALRKELLERPVDLDIGSCLGRAWETLRENMLVVVCGAFLIFISQIAIRFVPCVGGVLAFVLEGVLMGGLFLCYIRLIRGESPEVTDVFAGFSRSLTDLILAHVVKALLALIPAVGMAIWFFIPLILSIFPILQGGGPADPNALQAALMQSIAFTAIGVLVFILVSFALGLLWIFAIPLVADRQFGFWDAMEISRKTVMRSYFRFALLLILSAGLALAGVLCCVIGLVITAPLAMLMLTYAYEDILGDRAEKTG